MATPVLATSTSSAGRFPLVTKADANLPLFASHGPTDGLSVATPGTANLMDAFGNIETDVQLFEGYNPLRVRQVRTGGTADGIRALYNKGI